MASMWCDDVTTLALTNTSDHPDKVTEVKLSTDKKDE